MAFNTYNLSEFSSSDSLSLIKILETAKFPGDIGLFTVDVVSLYTNILVDHAMELVEEFPSQYPLPNGK